MPKSSKKRSFEPITFVPVEHVFAPMVEIVLLRDISGWADRDRRKKWEMAAHSRHIIDEDKARDFVAKGYAKFIDPRYAKRKPLSEDEIAEARSNSTVIYLDGGSNDG
jgi:hypothetical protein